MIRAGDTIVNPVTGERLVCDHVPGSLLGRALGYRPAYEAAAGFPTLA